MYVGNIKTLSLMVFKLLVKVKVFLVQVKVFYADADADTDADMDAKTVSTEWSCHKEYTYVIWKP